MCTAPAAPANGKRIILHNLPTTLLVPGEVVLFNCDTDHRLIGEKAIACELGGGFSAARPACVPADHGMYCLMESGCTIAVRSWVVLV